MAQAYAQLRKPDWPSLHELALCAARHRMVVGAAVRLSGGYRLPPNVNPPAPATRPPVPPGPPCAPKRGAALPFHLPHQPPVFDGKTAAAGERPEE